MLTDYKEMTLKDIAKKFSETSPFSNYYEACVNLFDTDMFDLTVCSRLMNFIYLENEYRNDLISLFYYFYIKHSDIHTYQKILIATRKKLFKEYIKIFGILFHEHDADFNYTLENIFDKSVDILNHNIELECRQKYFTPLNQCNIF